MLKYLQGLIYSDTIIFVLFAYIGVVYFSMAISNMAMGLAMLLFLIVNKRIDLTYNKESVLNYLLVVTPFLLTVVSVVMSNNKEIGLEYLWLRLPVLLVPIVVLFSSYSFSSIKAGALLFVLLTSVASLFSLYNAIDLFMNQGIILNPNFAKFVTLIQHPYFGIFNLIAVILLIELKTYKNKVQFISILLILSIGVLLSTSRLAYLLVLFIIAIYSFKSFSKRWATIVVFSVIAIGTLVVVSNESIRYKITRTIEYENSPRLWLWNNTYKVIKNSQNPVLGVGIGDFYSEQKDPYYFRESKNGTLGYNPHNQYLEFILTNGVFGLLFIASMFMIFLKVRKLSFASKIIFMIIASFAFTESIFNRQYGIQLYSVFVPLLMLVNFNRKYVAST